MSKSKESLTSTEMAKIRKNKYVRTVTNKRILYTEEFKEHFIEEYISGVCPTKIFKDAGFDVDVLGKKRIERAAARWRETFAVPCMYKKREKNPSHQTIHDLFMTSQAEINRLTVENIELRAKIAELKKMDEERYAEEIAI